MLSFQKPSPESIRCFLAEQAKLPFSYSAVGATATTPPARFTVDHVRIKVGAGEPVFRSAIAALRLWAQLRLGWAEAWPLDAPIQPGEVFAIMGRVMGLWWLNSCRIVYVVDETEPTCRFGFAYGTLPGHIESGEERFLIEWDRNDDGVWYDILAISEPKHFLARLGYPVLRYTQKRFRRDSAAAMLKAVRSGDEVRVG